MIITTQPYKPKRFRIKGLWFPTLLLVISLFVGVNSVRLVKLVLDNPPLSDYFTAPSTEPTEDLIFRVSKSYGVPFSVAYRLADYISCLDTQQTKVGVGLFGINEEYYSQIERTSGYGDWNLLNPEHNTIIAMALLSSLHAKGYGWREAVIIYVYGYPALASGSPSELEYVWAELESVPLN